MSTRAAYTVLDKNDTFHVYIHCDGYPSGAAEKIEAATSHAWPLPRFEASDFAAALVSANKGTGGGGVYFSRGPGAHGDLRYRYEITETLGRLNVRAFSVGTRVGEIFNGTLAEFKAWAKEER